MAYSWGAKTYLPNRITNIKEHISKNFFSLALCSCHLGTQNSLSKEVKGEIGGALFVNYKFTCVSLKTLRMVRGRKRERDDVWKKKKEKEAKCIYILWEMLNLRRKKIVICITFHPKKCRIYRSLLIIQIEKKTRLLDDKNCRITIQNRLLI